MALQASNRMENVKASLETYLHSNLVTTEGLTVDWAGGQGIDTENINEWVMPNILIGGKDYLRQVTSSTKGNNVDFILNINIFLRKGSTTNYHRLAELRDIVANYFQEDQLVTFTDYQTGGNPQIGSFVVREIMTDQEIPSMDAKLFQWNFSPRLVGIMEH